MPETPLQPISRRGFLESSAFAAGLPLVLKRRLEAADAKDNADGSPQHPLDPLSAAEMLAAVKILRTEKKLGDAWRFVSAVLLEPPKNLVRDWKPGQPFPR